MTCGERAAYQLDLAPSLAPVNMFLAKCWRAEATRSRLERAAAYHLRRFQRTTKRRLENVDFRLHCSAKEMCILDHRGPLRCSFLCRITPTGESCLSSFAPNRREERTNRCSRGRRLRALSIASGRLLLPEAAGKQAVRPRQLTLATQSTAQHHSALIYLLARQRLQNITFTETVCSP